MGSSLNIRIQTHRRPAPGHRAAGQGIQGRQSGRDSPGRHWFRKNIYDGECHPAVK